MHRQRHRPISGFTLIELLVVVALLGIIAAIGIPVYQNYLAQARNSAAQNGLRSIYLMEREWFTTNNTYYGACCGDQTNSINTTLFSGEKVLDSTGFYFYISANTTSFTAYATPRSGGPSYSINQLNQTSGF